MAEVFKPAGTYIEGNVPPVGLQWAESKPRLANDLRPHVEGVCGLLPVSPFQFRPDGFALPHGSYWQKTSMPKRKIQKDSHSVPVPGGAIDNHLAQLDAAETT